MIAARLDRQKKKKSITNKSDILELRVFSEVYLIVDASRLHVTQAGKSGPQTCVF